MKKSEIKPPQAKGKKELTPQANLSSSKPTTSLPVKNSVWTGQQPPTMTTGNQTGTRKPVGTTPADRNGLRGLFVNQLQDIYWAEKALNEKLPEMISKATSQELTDALQQHLNLTEKQISRCEDVLERLNVKVAPQTSNAMEGLIRDAKAVIDSTTTGSVRDAGIICATQKVDHFKIATYGTLSAFADHLGEKESAKLLKETLQEEKQADQRLTQVAQYAINEAAALA